MTNIKIKLAPNPGQVRIARETKAVIQNFPLVTIVLLKIIWIIVVFENVKMAFNDYHGKRIFKMSIYHQHFVSYREIVTFSLNRDSYYKIAWLSNSRHGELLTVNELGNTRQTYSQFRNFLRFFDVLPNFPLTTSETMCDYYL